MATSVPALGLDVEALFVRRGLFLQCTAMPGVFLPAFSSPNGEVFISSWPQTKGFLWWLFCHGSDDFPCHAVTWETKPKQKFFLPLGGSLGRINRKRGKWKS